MLVLPLCESFCPWRLSLLKLNQKIGSGYNGEIFSVVGQADRVVKLCVISDHFGTGEQQYRQVNQVLTTIEKEKPLAYVRVYEHGFLGIGHRQSYGGGQMNIILHYYEMEKLQLLSEDENKVFHTLLSHEDRNLIKDFSPIKLRDRLFGLSKGLDIDQKMVSLFCQRIKRAPITHDDLHPRNILKNQLGEFKLIDVDNCRPITNIEDYNEQDGSRSFT